MIRRSVALLLLASSWGLSCSSPPDSAPVLPGIDVSIPPHADAGGEGDTGGANDGEAETSRQAIENVPLSAEVEIAGLTAPVHVVRTELDVPHIYASNRHDLYMAEGFVLARDRYFEFEIARRLAQGRVSELLGDNGLAADMEARGQGMAYVAQRIHDHLDDETAAVFDAYAAGINAYIDEVRADRLPPPSEIEQTLPILRVEHPADAMEYADRQAVAAFAAFAVFTSSHSDVDLLRAIAEAQIEGHFDGAPNAELRQAGLEEDLWGSIAPVHAISVVPGFGVNGSRQRTLAKGARDPKRSLATPLPTTMAERVLRRTRHRTPWLRFGAHSDHGSNAWAVSGSVTASGETLLAGDGHLSLGIPPIFFQMGLDTTVFSDDDDLSVMGLFLPGFPFLAVGTNGDVAWSQTYPRADVVDWYREEVRLDGDGVPSDSLFGGEWRPLVRHDETYQIAAVLGSREREETWARWTTFDGRWLVEIEGRTVEDPDDEELADGEALVTMLGQFVVPSDVDGDGAITAVSMDYTAFDIGNLAGVVAGFQEAGSVEEFQSAVSQFVGYAQNLVSADAEGHVGFTPFTATPCRGYLPRSDGGDFVPGADPTLLLDGTTYGGFEIPLDEEGRLAPELAGDDPSRCVIPVEDFPQAYDPENGWVANANNDPAGGSFDDRWGDDLWYLGGPWVPGYRALAIETGLQTAIDAGVAGVETMAEIQGHHASQVGEEYAPLLIAAIDASEALGAATEPLTEHEERLRDGWDPRFEDVRTRLNEWLDQGAPAESGVETFYHAPTADDRRAAVATMVFNAWFRQYLRAIFDDEAFPFVFEPASRQRGQVMRAMRRLHAGRGVDNPLELASWSAETAESIFFDDMTTPEVERSDEMMLRALRDALDELTSDEGVGFGTADADQWLWGLRHLVRFESILASFAAGNPAVDVIARRFSIDTTRLPLAPDVDDDDPRKGLRWFPRPGDLFGVDAANHEFFGEDFTYANGPVMRMVIALGPDGVRGQNIIPGGQSGLTSSPHFDDQARLWLGNETIPMRFHVADVVEGATGREVLRPPAAD